ncbi:MAG: winged helix-turn-helix domain-containing protein [Candidatus Thermoplasmatota archaeon]|nr:winged helix-turn-helix domain-containing protein [Candidatus Thermoplasmatota archaeon]
MLSFKRLLWWILAGSAGGLNRARILRLLKNYPSNYNQIAKTLGLDYKTVRHHMDVLSQNKLVNSQGEGYGKVFFISPDLEDNWTIFEEIWVEIGKKNKTGEPMEEIK